MILHHDESARVLANILVLGNRDRDEQFAVEVAALTHHGSAPSGVREAFDSSMPSLISRTMASFFAIRASPIGHDRSIAPQPPSETTGARARPRSPGGNAPHAEHESKAVPRRFDRSDHSAFEIHDSAPMAPSAEDRLRDNWPQGEGGRVRGVRHA